jgi:hypothetical protein
VPGTISLFAAVVDVTRHRHLEFLRFLRTVQQQTPEANDFLGVISCWTNFFEKPPTGQDVLALTPRQLDEVLL